jgi:hypothetical protein
MTMDDPAVIVVDTSTTRPVWSQLRVVRVRFRFAPTNVSRTVQPFGMKYPRLSVEPSLV